MTLGKIELGKYYKSRTKDHKFHILTYINTKTFGCTLLAEWYNGSGVTIIPINEEDFNACVSDLEEITEDIFMEEII